MRVTITSDGTDAGNVLMDINSGNKIFISTSILDPQTTFSGNVLGIDSNGNIISVPSAWLTVSGASGAGWDDGDWIMDGTNTNIYRATGRVGIGSPADAMSTDKFYVTDTGVTEASFEDMDVNDASNINFKKWSLRRGVGAYTDRFYIGLVPNAFLNITTGGNVGIGTAGPKAILQVSGNIIAGDDNNDINVASIRSAVIGGYSNTINGDPTLSGRGNNTILGGYENTISGDYINSSSIVWWGWNMIERSSFDFIGGGMSNIINNDSSFSTIIWGQTNVISGSTNSVAGWTNVLISRKNYTFARNSAATQFTPGHSNAFLINAPMAGVNGGVGINVTDPRVELDIEWLIRVRPRLDVFSTCTADTYGSIYYSSDSKHFYGCTDVGRKQLDN